MTKLGSNTEIDFRRITSHLGDRRKSFEELCCLLCMLEFPGEEFVRVEGAGGDEGLEAFVKRKGQALLGIQAKYFVDPLKARQWAQINKSLKTAVAKNPKLSRHSYRDLSAA